MLDAVNRPLEKSADFPLKSGDFLSINVLYSKMEKKSVIFLQNNRTILQK